MANGKIRIYAYGLCIILASEKQLVYHWDVRRVYRRAWLGMYMFGFGGEIMLILVDIVAYNPYSLSMRNDFLIGYTAFWALARHILPLLKTCSYLINAPVTYPSGCNPPPTAIFRSTRAETMITYPVRCTERRAQKVDFAVSSYTHYT